MTTAPPLAAGPRFPPGPRARGALALSRARLRATGLGRLGAAGALAAAVLHGAMLLVLRIEDGPAASLGGTLRSAAAALAWIAAGPIALAAAGDRSAADRAEGIEALAAARGLSARALHGVRALAAMLEVASTIAVPTAALSLTAALLAGAPHLALRHLSVGAALGAFAVVCGVTLGGLAAVAGRAAGRRGRPLLVALIFVPWALADLAGNPGWSIPGALEAFLSVAVAAAGGPA